MESEEKKGITFQKSKQFALDIIKLNKILKERRHYEMASQILRSGTSIGANLAEANYAISKKDFFAKTYIALKECAETKFWLDILFESQIISNEEYEYLLPKCIELLKLLKSATKTLKLSLSSKL